MRVLKRRMSHKLYNLIRLKLNFKLVIRIVENKRINDTIKICPNSMPILKNNKGIKSESCLPNMDRKTLEKPNPCIIPKNNTMP